MDVVDSRDKSTDPSDERSSKLIDLLDRAASDPEAAAQVLDVVYDELCALAWEHVGHLPFGDVEPASRLVRQAWMRVCWDSERAIENCELFLGAAATVLRSILVDQARHREGAQRDLSPTPGVSDDFPRLASRTDRLLELNDALAELESRHPPLARVVMLRFFAGLQMLDIAEVTGQSLATVERDWSAARRWLQNEMPEIGDGV